MRKHQFAAQGMRAGGSYERNDEEVELFDVTLPRTGSNKDAEHPKGRVVRLRNSQFTATPKDPSFSSDTLVEAAESTSAVRMAHVENSGNSEGEGDPEGKAQSAVGKREENEEREDELEQEAYLENDSNENESTDNVSAEVNGETRRRAACGQGILCVTSNSVTDVNGSSSSGAPDVESRAERQLDVIIVNDSAGNSRCGENMYVPVGPPARGAHSEASVGAEEGRWAGLTGEEHTREHGAAICGETAAGGHGFPGDGRAEPCVTAAAAYTQVANCCSGDIEGTPNCGAVESGNKLLSERIYREKKLKDAACVPEEEAEELRGAELGLVVDTDFCRSNRCDTRDYAENHSAVALHTGTDSSEGRSHTAGGEEMQVPLLQPDTHAGELKSTSHMKAGNSGNKKDSNPSTQMRQASEQLTEGRGRSVVSSRRQLFEQGTAAVIHGRVPERSVLLTKTISPQQNGEQAGKEIVAATVVQEGRHRGEGARKVSVVEMLKERYERSTSESSVSSVRTQRLPNNRALSATLPRAKEGKLEPMWRRRQREKLQATQKATGQTCIPADDDSYGSMSKWGAAADETLEERDFGSSACVGGVAEASPDAEAVENNESTVEGETGNNTDSPRQSGQRTRRSVVTVHRGECSTVTSLKEKFERRNIPSTQGQQEQQQTQQLQRRTQQQRQQTLQQSAEGVKLLREQYERCTLSRENKSFPCSVAATSAPPPVATERPLRSLLKEESDFGESSTSQQHSDLDRTGTAAISPVKCLRDQYQRRLESARTPSPRAVTPISISTSTSVKNARELLSSVDIVGRYGKEYRIAKAEGALKKEQSHSGGEGEFPVTAADGRSDNTSAAAITATAASADEKVRSRDKCFRYNSLKNAAPDRHFNGKTNTSRQLTCQSEKAEGGRRHSDEPDTAGNGIVLEGESDPPKGYNASPKREKEAPVDALSTEPQPTVAERKAADRRAGEEALRVAATAAHPTRHYSDVDRVQSAGGQRPAVCAHVSSKIGALASALGPAFSNFGKAPPPRLLTRAEPEAGAEEIDPEVFGYSKAQEAIARRKRELRLLEKTGSNTNMKEEGSSTEETTGEAPSSENTPEVCATDRTKGKECENNADEGVGSITSTIDLKEQARDADSGEELSGSSVAQRTSSNIGGGNGGEVGELSRSSAGTEVNMSLKGEDLFNRSGGTEGDRPVFGTEDSSSSSSCSNCGLKFTRCISEDVNSCSSAADGAEAVPQGGTRKITCDCCTYKSSRLNRRNISDSCDDREAPSGMNGTHPHSRGRRMASEYNHSCGGTPTDTSGSDTTGETVLSLGLVSENPPHISDVESSGVGGIPAETVARKREAEDGRVPPFTAEHTSIPQDDNIDTGTIVENESHVSAVGRKTVTANDETQMALASGEMQTASAQAGLVAEEHTPVSAGLPAEADETDVLQEEHLETRTCCAEVIEGAFHQVRRSSVGGGRTRPQAHDEEETEEMGTRDEQNEATMGDVVFEQVEDGDVVASALEKTSATEDPEEDGAAHGGV